MFALLTQLIFVILVGLVFFFAIGSYWYKTNPKSFLAKTFLVVRGIIWGLTFLIGFAGGLGSIL